MWWHQSGAFINAWSPVYYYVIYFHVTEVCGPELRFKAGSAIIKERSLIHFIYEWACIYGPIIHLTPRYNFHRHAIKRTADQGDTSLRHERTPNTVQSMQYNSITDFVQRLCVSDTHISPEYCNKAMLLTSIELISNSAIIVVSFTPPTHWSSSWQTRKRRRR